MKRILSVILTLLLLTSALIIPVNAQNEAYVYEGDTYYKFTFGENGTSYRGEYVDKKIYTHKNNQYYALYDNEGLGKISIDENTIYDVNLGKNIDTMSIKAGGVAGLWRWVPLKADGTPFEVKPDATYTVNIKFYIKNLGSYGQIFAYACGPNTNIPTKAETDWQTGLFTTMGSKNGSLNDRTNIGSPIQSMSMGYAGTTDYVYDTFDSSNAMQYPEGNRKLITDNNATYNEEDNSYSFTFDVYTSKQEGSAYVNDQRVEDRVYNNYFFIGGSAKTFTKNGVSYDNTWEIAEIEVIYNDPNGVDPTVNVADFNNLAYPASAGNHYVADKGATNDGGKIIKNNFSVVDANTVTTGATGRVVKYDHVKDSYYSASTKTVDYAYAGVISLGKDVKLETSTSYKISVDYKAEKLDTPLKLGLMMGSVHHNYWTASEPKNTMTGIISETTDGWKTAEYYITMPNVYDVNVYNGVGSDRKFAYLYVKPVEDKDVTVYFDNFTVQQVPSAVIVDEFGNQTVMGGQTGEKIVFPEFGEGYEIYGEDGRGDVITGYSYYYDKDFKYPVNKENEIYTTKAKTYYYKGYAKLYDSGNLGVSFNGFENNKVTLGSAYKDQTNDYVIATFDSAYKNEDGKTRIAGSMIATPNGFYADNFAIVSGGFQSAKSLKYKNNGKTDLQYNVADISNGVLLKDNATYKLDFFYKAEGESDEPLKFAFLNMKDGKTFVQSSEITVTDVKNEWTRAEIYLTTDFAHCEKESGYSGETFCIPAIKVTDSKRTVYMDAFSITRVSISGGASALTDEAANEAGGQAVRFYFSYNADKNGNLIANGVGNAIKERGIMFTANGNTDLIIENRNKSSVTVTSKTDNFSECWNKENNVITYSTYVKNFDYTDSRTIYARGYIILADGSVAYSNKVEYSLDGILETNSLLSGEEQYYSLTDDAVFEKIVIQGVTRKVSKGYTFDWSGSTVKIKAKAVGQVKVYFENLNPSDYFTAYIDGVRISDLIAPQKDDATGRFFVTVDVGNSSKEKVIEVSRQEEAMYGAYEIVGFSLKGELLNAQENDKLIEFIGDSITSGMGVIGTKTDWRTDGTNAWGYLTAKSLDVDFRIRSKSGIGAGRDCNGDVGPQYEWISSYHLDNCFRDLTTPYTVNRESDIIIINLGTNDFDAYNWSPNATQRQELEDNYVKLLEITRKYNPNAKIICIAGGMMDSYGTYMQKAVDRLGGNDEDFYYYKITAALNLGGAGHPTEYQQRIIANEVLEILQRDFLK
ncbi:MAG: hypothetical protein IJ946_03965 [Clostridia bacterium]|nr:hypothetical protein [Clostridia bacterium]